eukprot:scaffold22819_cov28-Tisochrysis_lutea.AAC.2
MSARAAHRARELHVDMLFGRAATEAVPIGEGGRAWSASGCAKTDASLSVPTRYSNGSEPNMAAKKADESMSSTCAGGDDRLALGNCEQACKEAVSAHLEAFGTLCVVLGAHGRIREDLIGLAHALEAGVRLRVAPVLVGVELARFQVIGLLDHRGRRVGRDAECVVQLCLLDGRPRLPVSAASSDCDPMLGDPVARAPLLLALAENAPCLLVQVVRHPLARLLQENRQEEPGRVGDLLAMTAKCRSHEAMPPPVRQGCARSESP